MRCTICHTIEATTTVYTDECPDGILTCQLCAERFNKIHAETERIKEERV